MIVEISDSSSVKEINTFKIYLEKYICGGICTLEHKKIIENVYKVKVYYFLLLDEKAIPKGFIGFYINNNIAYGFNSSFIFDNGIALKELTNFLVNFQKKNNIKKIILLSEIKNTLDNLEYLNRIENKTIFIRRFQEINIDEVWKNQPGVFRTEVRKALKRGFFVKMIRQPKNLYEYYCNNNISKNIPIHKEEYFNFLYTNKDVLVLAALKDNVEIGYVLMMNFNIMFANFDKKYSNNGIMQLLYWECTKLAFQNKSNLNMGLSNPESKTAFFKKKCGGEEFLIKSYDINIYPKLNKNSFLIKNKIFNFIFNNLPNILKKHILKKIKLTGKLI